MVTMKKKSSQEDTMSSAETVPIVCSVCGGEKGALGQGDIFCYACLAGRAAFSSMPEVPNRDRNTLLTSSKLTPCMHGNNTPAEVRRISKASKHAITDSAITQVQMHRCRALLMHLCI